MDLLLNTKNRECDIISAQLIFHNISYRDGRVLRRTLRRTALPAAQDVVLMFYVELLRSALEGEAYRETSTLHHDSDHRSSRKKKKKLSRGSLSKII